MFKTEESDLGASIDLIIRATEQFVVGRDILQHEVQQLRGTLVAEKKRRKRGKDMGSLAKEESGQAMFFKIAAFRARQEEINAQGVFTNKLKIL